MINITTSASLPAATSKPQTPRPTPVAKEVLTKDNYQSSYLRFGDRQAGVSVVYSPSEECYFYNAYCLEMKLLKELFTIEYDFLDDALATINAEFVGWELVSFDKAAKKGCGSCIAKT